MMISIAGLVGLALVLIVCLVRHAIKRKDLHLPGPPTLPLIGNLHQAPKSHQWKTFHEWVKQYGPILKIQFGRDTIILLGDYETAHALLDQQSGNFSSRPYSPMAFDLVTKGNHILLRPYDAALKTHQRIEAPLLNAAASRHYTPVQDLESCHLLRNLFDTNKYCHELHRFSASIAYSLLYGIRIVTGEESEMTTAFKVQKNFVEAMQPGKWPCDILPALNALPDWLAPWKRIANRWFEFECKMHRSNVAKALASPSWNFTKHLFKSAEAKSMTELELLYDAGVMADAALDTTAHTLEMFVLAAVKNPRKIRLAQEELDRVVGRNRLPDFTDAPNLPYVTALITESMRWRTILPSGIPHANLEEATYKGYHIPKGSVIIPMHWSMFMDEKVFGDPQNFRPERWIDDPQLPNVIFGWGRRVCPGQQIAKQSLFYAVSRLLWAFDIHGPVDERGNDVPIDDMAFSDYFVIRPLPFQAQFVARDEHSRRVVDEKWAGMEKDINVILDSVGRQRGQIRKL